MKLCKNCKYYQWEDPWYIQEACKHPENVIPIHNHMTTWVEYKKFPFQLNSKNVCEWYKRKWWKVWVK